MNPGKERILKVLQESEDYISIEKLALLTGTGSRSVFRYINELRYTLARYDLDIESKYGKGVRITGYKEDLKKLSFLREKDGLSSLSAQQRQFAEIAFLCTCGGTVKLGSLAHIFGVSDSCISLDLSNLENEVMKRPVLQRLTLHRKPGEGTCIEGAVWYTRMALLYCGINIFSGEELGTELLDKKKSNPKLDYLVTALGLHVPQERVRHCIETAERLLSCSFTLFDYTLFYLYICTVFSCPLENTGGHETGRKAAEVAAGMYAAVEPAVPYGIAAAVLYPVEDSAEIYLLQCLLSSLEPAKFSDRPCMHRGIPSLLNAMETALTRENCMPGLFGRDLDLSLAVLLNTIIYKKAYGIPEQVRDYSESVPMVKTGTCIVETLNSLAKPLYGIAFSLSDVEPLRILIRSASVNRVTEQPGLRILVLCYEGICLSRLVATDIHIRFPDIEIVDITGAVTLTGDDLARKQIDLLVTTVTIDMDTGKIPCFRIPMPYNRNTFITAFRKYLDEHPLKRTAAAETADAYPGLQKSTYQSVHRIFTAFKITEIDRPFRKRKITAELARLIGKNKIECRDIKKAFDLREQKGHIYLEVANIRLFHCRSAAVHCAQAGLIRSRKPLSVILYLAAPVNATKEELFSLSLISSALIESDEFPEALKEKNAAEIERQLLQLIS